MEEKPIFLRIFGDTLILRVVSFLIVNEDFDYSKTDIANLAEVGYSTLKLFFDNLVNYEIVEHTRDVGKAKMYTLNLENPAVKNFRAFYWEITEQYVRAKHLGQKKVEAIA